MGVEGHADSASPPLPAPSRVGRYEILSRIASGGMATVYLARARGALGFEREVALKLTHAHLRESPEFAAVLLEEAKLAVRIRHSNVVSILDVGEDPYGVFLVMEYVEGGTLLGLMKRAEAEGAPLPLGIGMRILLDALAGLHAAHELTGDDGAPLGVVHRDFSPHNVLVGKDGVAKLTDFGIAKAATSVGHTATGVVKGKAAYMAPEQARGHAVDRRCDVWAAGIVAWELIAGRRLYPKNEDGVPVLLKVVSEAPPRLRDVRADVPPDLDEAVASALTMDVSKRCASAQLFARQLAAAMAPWERVADGIEVGEHIVRVAGAQLAERRAKLAQPAPEPRDATTLVEEAHVDHDAPRTQMTTAADPPVMPTPKRRRVIVAAGAVLLATLAFSAWAMREPSDVARPPAVGIAPMVTSEPAASLAPAPSTSVTLPTSLSATAAIASPPITPTRTPVQTATSKPRPRTPAKPPAPAGPGSLAPSPYAR